MTHVHTSQADFAERALRGFCDAFAEAVRPVPGGVVRQSPPALPKVALVTGGGSGHYPAFAGYVGSGIADGAAVGNVFSSPPTSAIVAVAHAAQTGRGVLLAFGNYQGDVLNFTNAAEQLKRSGVPASLLPITDDLASAPRHDRSRRRGIAGDVIVLKIAGAAAERGDDLDDVVRLATLANERTVTLGVAFGGCTMPGNATAQFDVPVGHMALGLGIHGEAGIAERPIADAAGLAQTLCDHVLAERPDGAEQRVAVVLNGLGATKYEELFVLWDLVREILRAEGLVPVAPLVGEYVTSLDMAGCSLSICWLTDELADCWVAPARTPAFRREAHDVAEALPPEDVRTDRGVERWPESSAEGRALGRDMADALAAVAATMADNEGHLAHLDSVAGDGDHGSAMTRGAAAAAEAAGRAVRAGAGAASVLGSAAEAWAAAAGGTSGALWERGLHAASQVVSDRDPCDAPVAATAVSAALREVELAGGARVGDKTIVDALSPFAETLNVEVRNGSKVADAWTQASLIATDAAASTADLKPRVGRARPLAERSYGHPDPGAVSFALCAEAVAGHIRTESTIS